MTAREAGPVTAREAFLTSLGFDLDPFQLRALDALDVGRSVLVAAPTGSGKTVVAEYAVAMALASGQKAFYTTPLKALSNQKYGDLVRAHGSERVGLLTGDNAINGEAPVVVMTTEVLRNMIYAAAPALQNLRYVVLDEVHYLQNPYRGAVWEEVIIHIAPEVDLVCLSATVSNAEEVADWIQTVRGSTEAIIEERRPVELHHLYMLGDRATGRLRLLPTFVDGRPNQEAEALERGVQGQTGRRGSFRHHRLFTPRRAEVAEVLREQSKLPAIYFIFSRAGCDDAVRQCLREGLRLTTENERRRIQALVETKLVALSDQELALLDFHGWLAGLEAGIAAHHAGLVPPFKEVVEVCFSEALVKLVFATETLSLGINMPARSVVIEKLTKFTGDGHQPLTPGEYTQLTGRAGRRGIDDVGFACVLWSPFVPFAQVAGLASKRTYALSSSFRPTYNMAANLVRRYTPEVAHHLLNLSFAQYRTDAEVVRLEAQLESHTKSLAEAEVAATCELGDVHEYRELVRSSPSSSSRAAAARAMERLRPGDVLVLPGRKGGARVAVLATSQRRAGDVRITAMSADRRRVTLSPRDFSIPPRPIGRVDLPTPYAPRTTQFQRRVAQSLASMDQSAQEWSREPPRRDSDERSGSAGPSPNDHPVAACPDAERHLRQADRAARLRRDVERLVRRVRSRTESLARQFDRVLGVLEDHGYVQGWSLTEEGRRLVRLYHEADLLVAECLEAGLLDGLDPPSMAGLVSVFTFEQRRPTGPDDDAEVWFPSPELRRRWKAIERLADRLNEAEEAAGLPLTRRPDHGFLVTAYGWAAGDDLEGVMGGLPMSGGDFVRNAKQLLDLLRQLVEVAPEPATAEVARVAVQRVFRGLVAASSVVTGEGGMVTERSS